MINKRELQYLFVMFKEEKIFDYLKFIINKENKAAAFIKKLKINVANVDMLLKKENIADFCHNHNIKIFNMQENPYFKNEKIKE